MGADHRPQAGGAVGHPRQDESSTGQSDGVGTSCWGAEQTGRSALDQLRRMLGVLRDPDPAPVSGSGEPFASVPTEPQPVLADVLRLVTTFGLDEYVYAVLRASASGFLLKDASAERLLQAVRRVAARETSWAPSVMDRLVATYLRGPDPRAADAVKNVTDSE